MLHSNEHIIPSLCKKDFRGNETKLMVTAGRQTVTSKQPSLECLASELTITRWQVFAMPP